jgi:hypothetical protein
MGYAYHFTYRQAVKNTPIVIGDIMDDGTFSRVEAHPEPPLLPLDETLVLDGEAGAFGLYHTQGLKVLANASWDQLGHVLGRGAVIKDGTLPRGRRDEIITKPSCGELVQPDNLPLLEIHDRDEGQRIGVEIGVGVVFAPIDGIHQALEIPTYLAWLVHTAIWPRLNDDLEAVGKRELSDPVLE